MVHGLKASLGDVVAFLDNDIVPRSGWSTAIVDPFKGIRSQVGGRVMTPELRLRVYPDAGQIRWYGGCGGNVAAVDAPHPFDVASVMEYK